VTRLLSSTETASVQRTARLVIEAECSTCGSIDIAEGLLLVQTALAHTVSTGHVVILNGTTDLPDEEHRPCLI